MSNELRARKNYIIYKKVEPEVDGIKSSLLLSPDDINPGLSYGEVISVGGLVIDINEGDNIYCIKDRATEINYKFDKIYTIDEQYVIAIIPKK